MQSITLIVLGKLNAAYYKQAAQEYAKRLSAYCRLEVVELDEELIAEKSASPAVIQKALEKEGKAILQAVPKGAALVAMCIEGKQLSSEELAEYFENHPTAEFLREWKARMDETFGDIEQMQLEERLRGEYIFNEIRERLEYKARALEQETMVQRRLMKAFPGLRSKRFDKELQEMRAQMEARKRKRKQKKGERK